MTRVALGGEDVNLGCLGLVTVGVSLYILRGMVVGKKSLGAKDAQEEGLTAALRRVELKELAFFPL